MRGGSNRRAGIGRSLLLGVGLVVFVLFGAVLWFAYADMVGFGASGPPPLIRAEAGPIKRLPDEPGGMELTNVDSPAARIFEEQAEPVRRERILPREDVGLLPPTPPADLPTVADGPQVAELAAPVDGVEPVGDPAAIASTPLTDGATTLDRPMESAEDLPPPLEAPEPSAAAVVAALEPERDVGAVNDGAADPNEPPPVSVMTRGELTRVLPQAAPRQPEVLTAPVQPDPPRAPPAATTPAPTRTATREAAPETSAPIRSAPAATPIYRVQLGAFRSDQAASQAWIDLQRRNRGVLGSLRPNVIAADTSSGTFYRLQAGPVRRRDMAVETCAQVKSTGNDCFIVGPLP
jgi:hypothetical protein